MHAEVSSIKIINHRFHVDNDKGESDIGYDIIIVRDLILQIGLTDKFKCQVLQRYVTTVHRKEPINLLGQSGIPKSEMCEVVIQTAEPYSTQEATVIMVQILYITYAMAYLKQVADNITYLNTEEITILFSLLDDFKDLFGWYFRRVGH